jgi:hypothetical protein
MVKSELEEIWLIYEDQTRDEDLGPKSQSVFLEFKEKQVWTQLYVPIN